MKLCAQTTRLWQLSLWMLLIGIATMPIACGAKGGSSSGDFEKVSQSGATFSPDDLLALGFKQSRAYSTDGLPGASAAIYGFWRPNGGAPVDYEVRFYGSHEDAVSLGGELAVEGTGDDAVFDVSEARYKEGVQDRRMIIGAGSGGGARSGIGPRYADYAVFANLVLLCQGGTPDHSLERCSALTSALTKGVRQ